MKKILLISLLSCSALASNAGSGVITPKQNNNLEKIFDLTDLPEKVNNGMTGSEYCDRKGLISAKQAKDQNAPLVAQQQLRKWVKLACNLDVMAEVKRVNSASLLPGSGNGDVPDPPKLLSAL